VVGVVNIKATVEDQRIRVDYDPTKVNPQAMLVELKKWADVKGKKVSLLE
jgi:hypothetical protein